FLLAQWHETGQFGYEISPNQAVELYQVAADANNPAAIFRVGRYKEQAGQLEEAVKLYQQAAIMRDASANHRLGVLLLTGEQGLHADPRSAIEYLRRSADRASRECPDGALMLGKLYLGDLLSRGILYPNPQEGRRLVELSASLGSADAHYLLGRCHEYGLSNFARDPTASLVSYQEAATRNHLDGCLSLAMWCMTGYPHVLEPSEQLALSWCRRA
ncbi:HCP-like protein, partial [Ramicandelaber brevisporus]